MQQYGIKNKNRWDIKSQANALVRYFRFNKSLADKRNLPEPYIYQLHHDGPRHDYGGFSISMEHVYPKIGDISEVIKKVF